ncbi:MAG: GTP-binding protein [Pseudanabaena sp.]
MSIATSTPQISDDPPAQVLAIAGSAGIGKTGWIFQQIEQISAPVVYFCPSAGNVPIDPTCLAAEFPNVQIFADGQELELIEQVEQGAIALIELGFHLDLRSGNMLLETLAANSVLKKIALVPSGLTNSEWHEWADQVIEVKYDLDFYDLQIWRSPFTGQVFDPSSLNVLWYEITQGAYGEVSRAKGIFDLFDGRAFYLDFVTGKEDSLYLPLDLPLWLDGRPERFSGIEVVGRNLDGKAIAQCLIDCCLSEEILLHYQNQIKQSRQQSRQVAA